MKRRSFIQGMMTTAAGLLLPYEPKRVYSFASKPLRRVRLESGGWLTREQADQFWSLIAEESATSKQVVMLFEPDMTHLAGGSIEV